MDQTFQRAKGDPEGTQLFPPVQPVVAEHGFDIVLIHGWIAFTDGTDVFPVFILAADLLLVGEGNLGIRNQGRRKKRVCCPAFGTLYPADPEPDGSGRKFYTAFVVAKDGQTGRMRTGTGQLMELEIKKVTVHTPLSRKMFWHEYAKIPRQTSQNSFQISAVCFRHIHLH